MTSTANQLGANRTGIDVAPRLAEEMLEAPRQQPAAAGDQDALLAMRIAAIGAAEPLGSVPVPATLTGMAKSMLRKAIGERPEVLVNKLSERLAVERTGTRLYDALLVKCAGLEGGDNPDIATVQRFRDEEQRHLETVWNAMRTLGADPTAVTPDADAAGITAMGLVHVLADPRTTLVHGLHAILVAELLDNEGWRLLIDIADELGQERMVEDFHEALIEEEEHLRQVRHWYSVLVLTEAGARGGQ